MNKYWECDYMENGYLSLVKEPDRWADVSEDGEMVYTMSEYPFELPILIPTLLKKLCKKKGK